MSRKDGKVISSLPISVNWPGVTIPKRHAFVNGCEELIICWGDSISINDGNIESYTVCFILLSNEYLFFFIKSFIYMIPKVIY